MPANTTSILQPVDQRVISTLKAYLGNIFHKATGATANVSSDGPGQSPLKNWKRFTILHAIKNIYDWWEELTISTWTGVWKKLIPASWVTWRAQDSSGGRDSRCGGNSEKTRSSRGAWTCDWTAAISWSNIHGGGAASYRWAKTVVSWAWLCSWWRCCEDGWNDNRGFGILNKLRWQSSSRVREDEVQFWDKLFYG